MKSEDNFFEYFKFSNSIFKDDLITNKNLSSNKNTKCNNIQKDSDYLGGNSQEKENEKCSIIKDELECENDKNINNFLTKDIINSINEINSEPNNNSSKNKSIKEISVQDETESSQQNREAQDDNGNDEDLKIEKNINNEFPVNLESYKFYDFFSKNNLTDTSNKKEPIINDNRYLNNNSNINNENDKNNCWNFNINPNKIFNMDTQKNQQNNEQSSKFNNNNINIHFKIDVNNVENSPFIKNKETTNSKEIFQQNEMLKLNSNDIKINNDGYSKKQEFFEDNFFHQKFDFQNQNNYIKFDSSTYNKQSQNNYIKNSFINKDNKFVNNFLEQEDLYNKLDINRINLNADLNEVNQEQKNILNNTNNFNLYMNNKIIYSNNCINLDNRIQQDKNINFSSYNTINNNIISLGKEKNNLNKKNYLITMFGKLGWICHHCNNFNFETRNICNRCKTIKTPKTTEEINEEKKIDKIMKKKMREKKVDWFCPNCYNINYGFRKFCNRCKIERKKEFPSVILNRTKNQM